MALDGAEHVLGVFGFDLTFLVGKRVEGKGFHEIVITAEQSVDGSSDLGVAVLDDANLTFAEDIVVLCEAGCTGDVVGLSQLSGCGIRESGGDNSDNLSERFTAFHGFCGFCPNSDLCGSCGCGEQAQAENAGLLHNSVKLDG